jgi:hypothetical protein
MGTTDHHPKAIQMSKSNSIAERVSAKRDGSNATCYRVYMGLGSPLSSGKVIIFDGSLEYPLLTPPFPPSSVDKSQPLD